MLGMTWLNILSIFPHLCQNCKALIFGNAIKDQERIQITKKHCVALQKSLRVKMRGEKEHLLHMVHEETVHKKDEGRCEMAAWDQTGTRDKIYKREVHMCH